MCSNPITEQLELAHAKVGLLASDIWVCDKETNDYKKANLDLWLRYNEVEQKIVDLESGPSQKAKVPRTVRDTIPQSRLASYGKFLYDEERESMYLCDYEHFQTSENSVCNHQNKDLEIWEIPEVEEEFKRLTNTLSSRWCSLSPRITTNKLLKDSDNTSANANTYQWLTKTNWPDEILTRYPDLREALQSSKELSLFNKDDLPSRFSGAELEAKLAQFPCPRYKIETNSDLRLHRCLQSPSIKNLWTSQHSYCPYGGEVNPKHDLNADVPEFKPTTISRDVRPHYYPSIYDKSYEADLFPYSNIKLPSNSEPTDIYSEHDRPPMNIPVFQTSPESYFGIRQNSLDKEKRVHSSLVPFKVSGKVLKKDANQTVAMLEKLVNKIYNPRSNDFSIINSSCSRIDKMIQSVHHAYCLAQNAPRNLPPRSNQRPLYSDVLMNSNEANTSSLVTASDSRYDELEQEALAQYLSTDSTPSSAIPTLASVIPTMSSAIPTLSSAGHVLPIDSLVTKKLEQQVVEESPCVAPEPTTPIVPGSSWNMGLISSEVKQSESRYGEVLPCESPRSCSPKSSPNSTRSLQSIGSKRCHTLESTHKADSLINKQATWLKKKKRKTESSNKKKKNQQNKKKTSINGATKIISTQQEPHFRFFEIEITYINKFVDIEKVFRQCFLDRKWKLVQEQISSDVVKLFVECLRGFSECIEWFKVLIMTKNLKEDYRTNKKRLELVEQTVHILRKLINLLQQYIYAYSKIRSTIQFDQRFYLGPEKLSNQKSLLTYVQEISYLNLNVKEEEVQRAKVILNSTWTKMQVYKLLCDSQLADITNTTEWNLGFNNYEVRVEQRTCNIQLRSHKYQLVYEPKEESKVDRKSVSLLDDIPIWGSWQWRFLDGWVFKDRQKWDASSINQFDTKCFELCLGDTLLTALYSVTYSHYLAKFKALTSLTCEPFWRQESPSPLSSKMMFLKVMVKSGEEWFAGDLWINKQSDRTCLMKDLKLGCECVGPCCVSVTLAPLAPPPSIPFPPPLDHETILRKIVRGDIEVSEPEKAPKAFCTIQ